jgi:nicotinamidase/pyrazinamidase
MKIRIDTRDALIIVDVQNDFLPGGALGVPNGHEIIPVIKEYMSIFRAGQIVLSRDWHPKNHCSFKAFGGSWPSHCVAATDGAMLAADLGRGYHGTDRIISKGQEDSIEQYSAFDGTTTSGISLNALLESMQVKNVFVGGLATDYCVLATVKDALRLEYKTFFLSDASKAVNVKEEDGYHAINTMKCYGAEVITLEDIV